MLVQAENQALRAKLARNAQMWQLVPDKTASAIKALERPELHIAEGRKATQLSYNGEVTFDRVMTAPLNGASRNASNDSSGQGEVSACIDLIQSGIRDKLVEDPRGLDQLAVLSMTQSAIGATEAPYDRMRQQRFAIKTEGERLAAMARDSGHVETYDPETYGCGNEGW